MRGDGNPYKNRLQLAYKGVSGDEGQDCFSVDLFNSDFEGIIVLPVADIFKQ